MELKVSVRKPDGPKQPEMRLFLTESMGTVVLMASDADGINWQIGYFDARGLHLSSGISPSSEFPVDKDGQLKVFDTNNIGMF